MVVSKRSISSCALSLFSSLLISNLARGEDFDSFVKKALVPCSWTASNGVEGIFYLREINKHMKFVGGESVVLFGYTTLPFPSMRFPQSEFETFPLDGNTKGHEDSAFGSKVSNGLAYTYLTPGTREEKLSRALQSIKGLSGHVKIPLLEGERQRPTPYFLNYHFTRVSKWSSSNDWAFEITFRKTNEVILDETVATGSCHIE